MSDNHHPMEKLIAALRRLYLPDLQQPTSAALEQHLRADTTLAVDLCTAGGATRALVLNFPKAADDQHWLRLCDMANALQQDLALPAPAVSVNGGSHYSLWLSFEDALPLEQMRAFAVLLQQAYGADQPLTPVPAVGPIELPPCLHRASGLWAAFINPAMGAALADDLGLEMPPPLAAQAAFLDSLHSISTEQFTLALTLLQQRGASATAPAPVSALATAG
ncbi:MAG: hypothetical protein ABW202_20200, partial [Duganella sp.]